MSSPNFWRTVFTPVSMRIRKGIQWRVRHARIHTHLFRAWLHRLALRKTTFIGITGSAGKTTTKDLVVSILSGTHLCHSNMLSRNERMHVADAVLTAQGRHDYAVLEMSGGKPGEIDSAVRLARPRIAALTIIGRDHYSAFKSIEAIAAEKGKLISSLPADGTAILNIDDPLIRGIGEGCNCGVIWVGTAPDSTIRLLEARSCWPDPLTLSIEYEGEIYTFATRLHGTHLALPILAALGIAVAAGIPLDQAIQRLKKAGATKGRMDIVDDGRGVHFVRDDFKSPHWTFGSPLEFMGDARARRKVAVVGTISDSPHSPRIRYRRAALEARQVTDVALFIGRDAHHALRARTSPDDDTIQAFDNIRDAARYLDGMLQSGDLVLLKGTNKSDHLGRLFVNRKTPIQCWEINCRIDYFCEGCQRLFQKAQLTATRTDTVIQGKQGGIEHNQPFLPAPSDNSDRIQVVIGLGNKGIENQWARHNIGFRALEHFAKMFDGVWDKVPEGSISIVVSPNGHQIILFKPSSTMNKSGVPIQSFLRRHRASADDCIVVHDDMDLGYGSVRAKLDGGDGGHNGLRSIIGTLGTSQFRRIRIGVRSPGDKNRARRQVLGEFTPEQEQEMERTLQIASQKIQQMIEMQQIQLLQSTQCPDD